MLKLSDHQALAELERVGYCQRPLLNSSQVAELAALYGRIVTETPDGFQATMYSQDPAYRRRVFEALVERLGPPLETVLSGGRICVANFLVKQPGETSRVGMHQDWSFVDERRYRSLNVWIPLVDVDSTNGCLWAVPGSHAWPTFARAHGDATPCTAQLEEVRRRCLRTAPLRAGQAWFYDGRLVHGSEPNFSRERRVAIGIVVVPREAAIWHCHRVSPEEVEIFQVEPDFFWRHVPGTRPEGVPLVGRVASTVVSVGPHQLEAVAALTAESPR